MLQIVIFFNSFHFDATNLSPAVSLTAEPKETSSSSSHLKSSSVSKRHTLPPVSKQHASEHQTLPVSIQHASEQQTLPVSNQQTLNVSNQHASEQQTVTVLNEHASDLPVSWRHTLTLPRVLALHLGDYACVANNTLGSNQATVTLTGREATVYFVIFN